MTAVPAVPVTVAFDVSRTTTAYTPAVSATPAAAVTGLSTVVQLAGDLVVLKVKAT